MTLRIDAHQHFWVYGRQEQAWRTPAHAAIARDYTPADLAACLGPAGVDATVLVQSVDKAAENERLLSYARENSFVAAVVAWLPMRDAAEARWRLPELARQPVVRGVRCLIGREPTDWLATQAAFTDLAAAGLAWDVVPVTGRQVADVIALARAVPDLRIVVDHMARPPVERAGWEPWSAQVAALAGCPNIAVKVSVGIDVLTDWPQWNVDDLRRYIDHVAGHFGPQRMILASNWPVVLLRRDYRDVWSDLSAATGFTGTDLAALQGGTAQTWYGITG